MKNVYGLWIHYYIIQYRFGAYLTMPVKYELCKMQWSLTKSSEKEYCVYAFFQAPI